MHTFLGDPFFFRVNKLNVKFWRDGSCNNLEEYIGGVYNVESDSERLVNNYSEWLDRPCEEFKSDRENGKRELTNYDLLCLIFKSFRGSYLFLFVLKLLSLTLTCFLAFSLKMFQDSFLKGSECAKGVILIINQIVEVTFNVFADYYTELLHIRVRGALTLFVVTLMLRGDCLQLGDSEEESLKHGCSDKSFSDTKGFARIQNVISVDGEFTEYMLSYGIELLLFPFNLFFIFSLTNIFIEKKSIYICMVVLTVLGAIAILSQYVSSYYKRYFMEARDERIACLAKSVSENDEYLLTHTFYHFYMNIVKNFRGVEMRYNQYRKYWFCLGEVMSYWMEISCTISICLYCYLHHFSSLKVSSILVNCSFVIPTLVRPISSIAYFMYYLVEATNALSRIKKVVNSSSRNHRFCSERLGVRKHNESWDFIDYVEDITIRNSDSKAARVSGASEIVLRKGEVSMVLDSRIHKNEPSMVNKMFKELLFSNFGNENNSKNNSDFKLYMRIKNKKIAIPNLSFVTKNIYYINQRSWLFESDTVRNAIICGKPFNTCIWNLAIGISQLSFDIENGSIQVEENINVKQISHGQRIRISLARTIYNSLFSGSLNKRDKPCIYMIENIFDYLDKATSFRLFHSLFCKARSFSGLFGNGFGLISVNPEMFELFVYSMYYDACSDSLCFRVTSTDINDEEEDYVQVIRHDNSTSISRVNVMELLSKRHSSYYEAVRDSLSNKSIQRPRSDEVDLDASISESENNLQQFTNDIGCINDEKNRKACLKDIEGYGRKEENSDENRSLINGIQQMTRNTRETDTLNNPNKREIVTSSLFYYLFQTNDKVRYKYDTEMNKNTHIKRNKTMISSYILLSILPVLLFKVLEYLIFKHMRYSNNIQRDLLRYVALCTAILGNYFATIFLEIRIGLKSANYIHNTVLYSYFINSSISKMIPVSSIIGHLSNDQLIIDYCITKRIGQTINQLNKILSFIIISLVTNSDRPFFYLPVILLYLFFIHWNYISYFVYSCRMLRLMYLNSLTSLTDVVHSINYGFHDITAGNITPYIKNHCIEKAANVLAPLYGQNVIFAWLRLRIDLLLPVLLTSINVLTSVVTSRDRVPGSAFPDVFIYVIGIGLTIPKITSSASKYWVKMENELLAVTRMKLLIEALKDNTFERNLEILEKAKSHSVLSLRNVESRYYKLSEDPFSINMSDYRRLQYSVCLKDISLKVKRGDVVGVVGRTGSGKTTLLKLLGGALETSSGIKTIYMDGNEGVNYEQTFNRNGVCKMKESSLSMLKCISKLSEIDPNVLLNSIKMLEILSFVAYLPVRVDFPCNVTLREVIDPQNEHLVSNILFLLNLFGLTCHVTLKNSQCGASSLIDTGNERRELLDEPLGCFQFNKDQLRFVLLVRFLLNSRNYKLVLIDELPNLTIYYNNKSHSIIDFIVERYFYNSCVVIATHNIENISTINRIILVKNDHSICEIERSN